MAGGIFITQNKIRPGFYHRFTAAPREKKLFGEIGVAALPLCLDWGEEEIVALDADGMNYEFTRATGYDKDEILLIRECLKRARRLLLYRVNGGGSKASLDMSPQPVMAAARCEGSRGNDIAVQIDEDEDRAGRYLVRTYVDSIEQDVQSVENAEEIVDNDWVSFAGSGAITAAAGGQLTGGANGTDSADNYAAFLTALESEDFNAFGLPVDDPALKADFAAAAKRYVEQQGKLVQCVLPDYAAEYEAVTSLKNGVALRDGTVLDKAAAVAWYTGAAASAGASGSLTYTAYDGGVRPDVRLSDDKIKQAIKAGHVVFVPQKNVNGDAVAVVEQDIDTLTRFTEERPQPWGKNRVVRALYYLVNSMTRVWHLYYIGKVDNNAAGRNLFKADLATMMRALEEQGAFENFDAEEDITVEKGEASDTVVATLSVQPVDAMEKMYMTIELA